MALDGITIRALRNELADRLVGGRIAKIVQPEADELLLTIKTEQANERLLISAGATLPFVYLTDENKQAPMTAPGFCMLLRKHISGGRLVNITQPGLERIISFEIEHLDEMGDLCRKIITVELMGKHSNIIFMTPEGRIIDSIKHVSAALSSVREVLPGRDYFIPKADDKLDLHNYILCNCNNDHDPDVSILCNLYRSQDHSSRPLPDSLRPWPRTSVSVQVSTATVPGTHMILLSYVNFSMLLDPWTKRSKQMIFALQ